MYVNRVYCSTGMSPPCIELLRIPCVKFLSTLSPLATDLPTCSFMLYSRDLKTSHIHRIHGKRGSWSGRLSRAYGTASKNHATLSLMVSLVGKVDGGLRPKSPSFTATDIPIVLGELMMRLD